MQFETIPTRFETIPTSVETVPTWVETAPICFATIQKPYKLYCHPWYRNPIRVYEFMGDGDPWPRNPMNS